MAPSFRIGLQVGSMLEELGLDTRQLPVPDAISVGLTVADSHGMFLDEGVIGRVACREYKWIDGRLTQVALSRFFDGSPSGSRKFIVTIENCVTPSKCLWNPISLLRVKALGAVYFFRRKPSFAQAGNSLKLT